MLYINDEMSSSFYWDTYPILNIKQGLSVTFIPNKYLNNEKNNAINLFNLSINNKY